MRDSNTEVPILVGSTGPLQGQMWPLVSNLTIGRDPECDIVIANRQVSRQHAHIFISKDQKIQIEDNQSKNGTFLNGKKITEPFSVEDGDILKIALIQTFQFLSSDATIPLDQPFGSKILITHPNEILSIDSNSRSVKKNGKDLTPPLSDAQFRLLHYFSQNEGEIVAREEIITHVWGSEVHAGVSEQAIDALVRRLRKRLGEIDSEFDYIQTVRGVGFIFRNRA